MSAARCRRGPTEGGATPYGRAEAGWRRGGEELVVEVLVPPGTRAEVRLPGDDTPLEVGAGRHVVRR
ncbi:alpha-L-rhamnosidase C-terminal domain-containing protein [Streptomyces luomodiensis]|uniref:alpha-L-rhamnosidase C-terminal domain-containing protein n=1 Tax=Streptomyces luomodiensis TaxID=3026192 RepID=UPI00287BA6B2|nr:alpha-L-rhamnosidase C-terminal domain-containing protein [Streptomyces sp. SCA4-21]